MPRQGGFPSPKRRGAHVDPPNRFERIALEPDLEQVERDPDFQTPLRVLPTEFFDDQTRSIVTSNDSPDLYFRYSCNPYRGCEHGCSYCYARPYHEYLGFSAGTDFETKILVKRRAPELFREFLARPDWSPEPIMFSGVTDCYQPIERRLRLTRGCLEVALEANQPIEIITKSSLVLRDQDLLEELARRSLVHVNVAVTTLDADIARAMEPRASSPTERLGAIKRLSKAGVPVRALVAPLVPGLTDSELPSILKAAAERGASSAGYVLLRLPGNVRPVFLDWLSRAIPLRADRVLERIRATRSGELNDPRFGSRMRGKGEFAEQIAEMFRLFAARFGLSGRLPPLDVSRFRPPRRPGGQQWLF